MTDVHRGFRGAIARGDLGAAERAAVLSVLSLMAEADDPRFERAAVRRLGRLFTEAAIAQLHVRASQ